MIYFDKFIVSFIAIIIPINIIFHRNNNVLVRKKLFIGTCFLSLHWYTQLKKLWRSMTAKPPEGECLKEFCLFRFK